MRIFTTLLFVIICCGFAHSQVTFNVENKTLCNGETTVSIEVAVQNFNDIAGMQYTIAWDETVIDFSSVSNFHSNLSGFDAADFNTSNANNGEITLAWISPNVNTGNSVPDDDAIFTLNFSVVGNNGDASSIAINSNATPLLVAQAGNPPSPAATQINNGSVSVGDFTSPLITCPANNTVNSIDGNPVVVGNLTATTSDVCGSITAVTYSLTNATTGNSPMTGINDASGTAFNIGTTTVQYTVTDNNSNSNTCSFDIIVNDASNGEVIFTVGSATANCAGTVSVDITVENFTNITGMQYTISWDELDLGFASLSNFHANLDGFDAADFNTTNAGNGDITLAWISGNPAGVNVPDGAVIFSIDFNIIATSGTTNININGSQTPILIARAGPMAAPFFLNEGTVTINDNTPPILTCPSNLIVNSADGNPVVVNNIAASTMDDCGVASLIYNLSGATTGNSPMTGMNDASGTAFNIGNTTVQYSSSDINGNSSTCDFQITVNDDSNNDVVFTVESATANCFSTLSLDVSVENFTNITGMQYTINWDESQLEFTSIDNFHANLDGFDAADFNTTNSNDGYITVAWISGNPAGVNVTDGEAIFTLNFNILGTAGTTNVNIDGSQTPVLVARSGPIAAPVQLNNGTVSFGDTTPPVVTCPANITQSNDTGQCSATVNWAAATATDNCDGNITPTTTIPSGSSFPVGSNTVTYTATDNAGNTDTCSFTIIITDNEAPVFDNCPSNFNEDNTGMECGKIITFPIPTATDNCDGVITATQNSASGSGDFFPVGTTVINYSVTDMAGNSKTCIIFITINDVENPTITCPQNITSDTDSGNCSAMVTWNNPTTSDNCDVDTFNCDANSGDTFPIGTTTVNCNVTDIHGNTASCDFTITVTDNESPTIANCPTNITQMNDPSVCSADVSWAQPTASDNCGIDTFDGDANSGDTFQVGETTVTYTATDIYGNTSNCQFEIKVVDNEIPLINNCPDDIFQNTTPGMCTKTVNWEDPIFTDNCGIDFFLSSANPDTPFPTGSTPVTYTVTDFNGNTATCSFNINISDNEAPIVSNCPTDINQNTDIGMCSATVTWDEPTATDNCGIDSINSGSNSGNAFPAGSTTVTYTATDVNGNTATCSFNITITDNEVPTIADCPANINQNTDAGICTATVTWDEPIASDNCGIDTFDKDANSGDVFPVGETTVTYSASDINGNTAICQFVITVADNELPTIINCPADIFEDTTPGMCTKTITWEIPTFADNCGIDFFFSTSNPGDIFSAGSTTVTYTPTDFNGNTATCSFNVNISDIENPTIANCPTDIAQNTEMGMCSATVTWDAPTANDNCGIDTFDSNANSGDAFPTGSTTVTYTATDVNANTTICEFVVTISDNENPTIANCPTDIAQNTAIGMCSATVTWDTPIANDNCGIVSFISDTNSGNSFPTGSTTVTYTATDANGNQNTCSFNIMVFDNESPAVSCPENMTYLTDSGMNTVLVNDIAPTTSDNCGINTVTFNLAGDTAGSGNDDASGTNFNLGETLVTYLVTDAAGNSNSCSFVVAVEGCTATEFDNCPTDIAQNVDAGTCQAVVTWTPPTSPCPNYQASSSHQPGDTFPVGTTVVTYIAANGNGDSFTCSFSIIITDNEAPQNDSCPTEDIIVDTAPNTCEAQATWATPTFSDNCIITNVINSHNSGDVFSVGQTTVNYTATDGTGLTAECNFNVVVNDAEMPVIANLSADMTMENDEGICGTNVSFAMPIATDNCGIASFNCTHESGSFFPVGQTQVTCTALDINGNIVVSSFTITVEDTEEPSSNCPTDIIVNIDGTIIQDDDNFITNVTPQDCENLSIELTQFVATDNCQLNDVTQTMGSQFYSGTPFPIGISAIEFVATDMIGNETICNFDVTVQEVATPTVSLSNSSPCVGDDVTFEANGYPNSSFVWKDSNGQVLTTGATLTLNNVSTDNSGSYTLETIASNGCILSQSVTINVSEKPDLTASANDILCTEGNLDLNLMGENTGMTTINTWTWSGPNNFTSNEQNPTIPQANTQHAGTYTLIATSDAGCTDMATIEVNISESPALPMISADDNTVCIGDEVVLTGQTYNGNIITYQWQATPSADVILNGNDTQNTTAQINAAGDFTFSFSANVDGCESAVANIFVNVQKEPTLDFELIGETNCVDGSANFQINEIIGEANSYLWETPIGNFDTQNITVPNTASSKNGNYKVTASSTNGCEAVGAVDLVFTDAITDFPSLTLSENTLCEGGDVTLFGNNFGNDAIYHWIGEGLPMATLDTSVTTNLSTVGTYPFEFFVEIDGCFSDTINAGVTVENAPILNPTIVGNLNCVEGNSSISLMSNSDSGTNFIWKNENGDTLSNTENLALENITFVNSGNYEIIAQSAIGCESSSIIPVEITNALPPISARLEGVPCEDESLQLCADPIVEANYQWVNPDGNVISNIQCPTLSLISSQFNGTYQVTANVNGCTSTASVDIEVLTAPTANDDQVAVIVNTVTEFDVISNDETLTGQNVTINILQNPARGTVENLGNGLFRYTPQTDNLQPDIFTYEICYTDCPNTCDIAFVTLNHQFPTDNCQATTVITPNEDGINDRLTFFCLDVKDYPNNQLLIFNVWGDKVFEMEGYDNTWDGTRDGSDLPDGTYYYVFRRDEISEADKGFVMIYR